jgi:exoribonuclease II
VQLREEIAFDIQGYVQERAAQLQRNPPREDFERPNFTKLSLAIDDPTTSEVDDAVGIEKLPEGGWQLTVHVADPSALVRSGDPLDLEALNR